MKNFEMYDSIEILKRGEVTIPDIINTISLEIKNNMDIFEEVFRLDNIEFDKENFLRCLKIEENNIYGKINDSFKNEFGIVTNINSGYGILTYISKYNNPYHLLECISKCLQTRNALLVDITGNPGVNFHIVKSVKAVLKSIGCENLIEILNNENDIFETNAIILIGKDEEYKEMLKYNKPIIYLEYNKYILYVEDNIDIELAQNIKKEYGDKIEIYSKIELDVEYTSVSNIQDFFAQVNKNKKMHAVGIFSKDTEVIKIFLNNIYAKNILVNVSPTLASDISLSCNELLYTKNIIKYIGGSK